MGQSPSNRWQVRPPNRRKPRPGNSEESIMDERWIVWLAGLVDGEGTIGLHRSNHKNFPHPYLRPAFQIANTDMRLLNKAAEVIAAITGKRPSIVVANKGGDKWKRGYRLNVHTQWELVILLPMLKPWLIGKAEQAQLVLEFCQRRYARQSYKWYEFASEDEIIYMRCLALNRRGASVESGGGSPMSSRMGEGAFRTTEESVEAAETTAR